MNQNDLELLSCLLDNELDEGTATALIERLKTDKALQAEYVKLTSVNMQFKDAVLGIDEQRVSPKLQNLLDSEFPESETSSIGISAEEKDIAEISSPVHRVAQPNKGIWQKVQEAFAGVIPESTWGRAAFAALVPVAFSGAILFSGTLAPSEDEILQSLDYLVSGESISIDGKSLAQTFAFMRQDQTLCKRYIIELSDERRDAIACQQKAGLSSGQWQEVISQQLSQNSTANAGQSGSQDDVYLPAGAEDSALDQYMESKMEGIPLTVDQERDLRRSESE